MLTRTMSMLVLVWLIGSNYVLAEGLDFGSVAVGASASLSSSGTNDSDQPVAVSAAISGPNAQDFSVVLSCGGKIPPAGGCTATVTFLPRSQGTKTAALTITISTIDYTGALDISLTGVGVESVSNPGVFDPHAGVPATLPPVVQSVTPSGTATSLSLSTQMKFDSLSGQQGSIFVGARVPPYATGSGLTGSSQIAELKQPQDAASETWYVSNGSSWSQLGASIPSVFTGPLTDANALVDILKGVNTAGLCGTEFYVGYGTDSSAMLTNQTMGMVYTVMCNFDFTGSASGSSSGLTLNANIQVATADAGKNGGFYVGRLMNNQWTLHNGSAWVAYSGGAVPLYADGVLSSRQIPVFINENVQSLTGAQIYVGYGLNEADLLGNTKYKLVYTIQ